MFKSWIRLTPCWEMLIFRHINRELDNGEFKKVPISGMTIVHTYYIITVYPYVMLLVVVACKHRHIQYTCLYIYTHIHTPLFITHCIILDLFISHGSHATSPWHANNPHVDVTPSSLPGQMPAAPYPMPPAMAPYPMPMQAGLGGGVCGFVQTWGIPPNIGV